ncbi:MAG: hypothetical protein JNM51_01480 [Bacteroidia bacterium]|nr:hypothetical protein [Bacteroidia bacterium]
MNSKLFNTALATLLCGLVFLNCQKKENTTPVKEEAPVNNTPICFNPDYNGTYVGNVTMPPSSVTNATLVLNKVSCQAVDLNLYLSTGGGSSSQASQLVVNGSVYSGKLSNGSNVTITPGSNYVIVNAANTFTFNGNRP